ncbi:MAG: transporter substrate-binding domain-containing protein [Acidobacteriota bacterium]|jgi:ABC-type amino acid transport substrate-binding protein|nr:transporter substrate-binding domain-containing protein [Acidobacteriota bacterium]
MTIRKYQCTNFANCNKALEKAVIEIPEGDDVICPECGRKLEQREKDAGRGSATKVLAAIVVLLLLAGLAFFFLRPSSKPDGAPGEKAGDAPASAPAPASVTYTARENVLRSIKEAGVLRVAVEQDAKPFNWIDKTTGRPTGFESELVGQIARTMGIGKVEMVWTSDYDDIPNMISKERDQADIFMGGYVANPNIPGVAWSDPYYDENGYCLVVPAGSAIKSLKDLRGRKVGVYNEDAAEEFVKESVTAPAGIFRFEDEDEDSKWMMVHLLEPLAKQRNAMLVDAIVYDYVFAKEEIKLSDGQLKIVAFNLNYVPYQIGVPKNNYELLAEVNRAIKKVKDSAQYEALVRKYLDFDTANVSLPPLEPGVKTHSVVAGETLGKIAAQELGDAQRWPALWEANKSRIPNPHLIHVGDRLIIP